MEYNILIVEDEVGIRETISVFMKNQGYHVYVAENGVAGLQLLQEKDIHLAIVDVMMPVMNGYEATKMIRTMDRSDAKKIPIIAMTANAFVEDRIKSKEAGMNEHVSKPIDMKLLVKIIAELAGKIKSVRIKDE